ncbi:Glucosylceramidase [Chionoecetes opilio]|uniref:Glucosylceramidase n=1 Tax=Chionoecetes opilio TaxID=41210 RepID=A0A8J5CNG1_CHIOP|nr:Glucosylceramidase [Chionoecetes opilio]
MRHRCDTDAPPLFYRCATVDRSYSGLPLLRRALGLARRPMRVLASPWSAPAWMKSNGKINETGELLREMWQPWANYLVKFIKEYEKAGVPLWAVTPQNHAFSYMKIAWNSQSWSPSNMRDWIKGNFGPALHNAGLEHLKLYVGDDNRDRIDFYSRTILQDPEASRYVSGVAVHWYTDPDTPPASLTHAHLLFPDKDILYTEACIEPTGLPSHQPVILGSWSRAERYAENIIQAKDEFYQQPMFFVMGHFSKFVPEGSVSVPSWVRDWGDSEHTLHTAAFIHPHGHLVLQLLNKDDEEREVRVEWEGWASIHSLLPPRSLQTLLLPWDGDITHGKQKYSTQGHRSDGQQ